LKKRGRRFGYLSKFFLIRDLTQRVGKLVGSPLFERGVEGPGEARYDGESVAGHFLTSSKALISSYRSWKAIQIAARGGGRTLLSEGEKVLNWTNHFLGTRR